jgi:hypothetical protein
LAHPGDLVCRGFGAAQRAHLSADGAGSAAGRRSGASRAPGGDYLRLRRRWLWTLGAFINGMVIFIFVQFYVDRPAVLFSAGGIVSKLFQFLLEATLIYLIITYRRGVPERPISGRLEPQP